MKFLHTSDIHIGAKFLSLGSKGQQQRNQIKYTFEKVVELVIESRIDLILISGDIFDHPYPTQTDIAFVKNLFSKLEAKGVWVVVISGNHDRLENGSVWLQDGWKELGKLIIFSSTVNHYYIDELDTHVYGNPIFSQFSNDDPLKGLKETISETRKIFPMSCHIVLAHGSIDIGQKSENYLMPKSAFTSLGADYVALGDWHSMLLVNSRSKELTDYIYSQSTSPAFYSGSPEMVDLNQTGAGYIIIGEFIDRELHIKHRKIGVRVYDTINLQLELFTLEKLIAEISKSSSTEMIKIVNLKGTADFDLNISEIREILQNKFWKLEINLSAQVQTQNQIFEPGTVAYEFTELMKNEIKKTINEDERSELVEGLNEGLKYLHS